MEMKKMICFVLACMMLLTGCQAAGGGTTPPETTAAPTVSSAEGTQPQMSTFPTLPEGGFNPGPVLGGQEGDELPFENASKVRLNYEGNRSYVRYVTSVQDLPKEGSWTGYDESYFETKALLIVVETLNSGSVQVDMESILVNGNTAGISIKRTMSGDVGTADMATWMLWAEVEKGLEYEWTLVNASQLPEGEKY
jgi:hypothetical protein